MHTGTDSRPLVALTILVLTLWFAGAAQHVALAGCPDLDQDGFCPPADCDDTIPHFTDTDLDGVPDACDVCPLVPDPDQLDGEGFIPVQIDKTSDGPQDVAAADLDGDGDLDAIVAIAVESAVAWYPYHDSSATFGARSPVAGVTGTTQAVRAGDIDGDGDIDVAHASVDAGMLHIRWSVNGDGLGSFVAQSLLIATEAVTGITTLELADIDGDGDLDVLAAAYVLPQRWVAWYENLDGAGTFGVRRQIAFGILHATAADIDGDADLDLLAAGPAAFGWYENIDGVGTFAALQPVAPGGALAVLAADLDGDADLDAIAVRRSVDDVNWLDHLVWFANDDGLGSFGTQSTIDFLAVNHPGGFSLAAADIDRDGDVDVLSALPYNGVAPSIAMHDNLGGGGNFDTLTLSDDEADAIAAADIDRDGDMDVLGASAADDRLTWYRQGDGVGDACDVCPEAADPLQADADADGAGDACDNCVDVPDADQLDQDLDGVGDVCDICPATADPDQLDGDADGIGDLCDSCPEAADPEDSDGDGDLVGDVCDNCPAIWNGNQRDTDADGAGDPCDCAPGDPAARRPGLVRELRIGRPGGGSAALSWASADGADSYSVSRGSLVALAPGMFGACLAPAVPGPSLDDPALPSSGDGFVYLVNGVNAVCGPGPLGAGSDGMPRVNGDAAACP